MSSAVPKCSTSDSGVRHLGQGHRPLSRMLAIITLRDGKTRASFNVIIVHILFGVVCGIGQYTRVKPADDTITACNDYAVCVSIHKFVVEHNFPLRMV